MIRTVRLPGLALLLVFLLVGLVRAERAVRRTRSPALSPDGSRIAFMYRGDLWTVAREGGRARRLTSHPAYDASPVWSPDGTRIAFSSLRHDRYDAFVVNARGGTPRRITQHSGHDLVEDWIDDRTLLIRTTRSGSSDLAVAPLDGSTPRLLTRTPMDGEMYATVVPGGEMVLLSDKSADAYRRARFEGASASDVWVLRIRGEGPRWRRLVDSEFMDLWPHPTTDGQVLFVSNRSGAPELWRVPLAGGAPERITRLGGRGARRPSVSRDGRWTAFDHDDRIHVMALPGGSPRPVDIVVTAEPERNPVEHRTFTSGVDEFDVSPDGALLALVVRGEVFVVPVEDGGLARNVTGTVARETQVSWGADSRTLYFVSDRDGNREVYRHDLVDGTTARLTRTPENEAWPRPSPDGTRLVWTAGSSILRIRGETPGAKRRKLVERGLRFEGLRSLEIAGPLEDGEAERRAGIASSIARGKEPPADLGRRDVPFLLRAMGAEDPETEAGQQGIERLSRALRSLTGYPMASPEAARHGPDAFRLVAVHWETYWNDRREPGTSLAFTPPEGFRPPTVSEMDRFEPIEIRARLADVGLWGARSYDWSPDSRWLAFTERGAGYRTDIRIVDVRDGTVRPVTAHPSARHPRFSGEGAWLSFVSSAPEDDDVYVIRLSAPDRVFPDDPLRKALEDEPPGEKKKDETPAPVEIAFDRIAERAVQATAFPTNEGGALLSGDGETVFFTSDLGDSRELWSLPAPHVEGPRRLRPLTKGEKPSAVRLSPDGKRLLYLSSGRIRSIPVTGGSSRTHGFRAEMAIDRRGEMTYVLEEALWLLRTWFYDPALHGADWEEIGSRYRALLTDASPGLDLEALLDDLCAELEASHLGASGGASGGESEPATGELGVELDDAELVEGRFVVAAVLVDGPADHRDVALSAGDRILEIEGQVLGVGVNLYERLRGTVGRRVEMRVRRGDGEVRTVVIRPCDARRARDLRYETWVRERREKVRAWSDGRLAYLHVRSMNRGSLTRFRREILVETVGKKGAIVDVRYNGGGWTAVHVLDALARRPYVMRSFRNGTRVSENVYRDTGLEIPLVALTNHASFSNAEIFSEGFRRLGLGPVVGVPTAGGVIGTSTFGLLNGMRLRRPSWAAWTLDGESLEGHGRPVTHRVENGPGREGHAEDRQLRKAVELLLK